MKKIILFILSVIVFYIISIFLLPSVSSYLSEKLWLIEFNNSVIKIRSDFNDFITNFDITWKYSETKNSVFEIKQNVENQVWETKKQIETIQTSVEKTKASIEETTNAVNNTINSLNELQQSIVNVLPKTSSWETNSWITNN